MWPLDRKVPMSGECFVWLAVTVVFMLLSGSLWLGYKYTGQNDDAVEQACSDANAESKNWYYFWLTYGYFFLSVGFLLGLYGIILLATHKVGKF